MKSKAVLKDSKKDNDANNVETTKEMETLKRTTRASQKAVVKEVSVPLVESEENNKVKSILADQPKEVSGEKRLLSGELKIGNAYKSKYNAVGCFHCNSKDHRIKDCPQVDSQQCYKCGSTEHMAFKCSLKIEDDSYPFASCLICKKIGHIVRQCPDNKNGGRFVMTCRKCGAMGHFRNNCPRKNQPEEIKFEVESVNDDSGNITGSTDEKNVEKPAMPKSKNAKRQKKIVNA